MKTAYRIAVDRQKEALKNETPCDYKVDGKSPFGLNRMQRRANEKRMRREASAIALKEKN